MSCSGYQCKRPPLHWLNTAQCCTSDVAAALSLIASITSCNRVAAKCCDEHKAQTALLRFVADDKSYNKLYNSKMLCATDFLHSLLQHNLLYNKSKTSRKKRSLGMKPITDDVRMRAYITTSASWLVCHWPVCSTRRLMLYASQDRSTTESIDSQ